MNETSDKGAAEEETNEQSGRRDQQGAATSEVSILSTVYVSALTLHW